MEKRRYRLRFLNGCDSRFLILDFSSIPGVSVWQIGNEGGFLPAPVNMTALNGGRLLMCPAERADVIVDFTNVPAGSYILRNIGPDEPFGGGEPDVDFDVADPSTTGQIMQFRVVPAQSCRSFDSAAVPGAAGDCAPWRPATCPGGAGAAGRDVYVLCRCACRSPAWHCRR